jgi:D-alanyl-D-alanine carboxypeptidase
MENIDSFLTHKIEGHKTPSIQYSFFDTDAIIYGECKGLRHVCSESPINADTTYHLYSITKTFTALSVLQLAQLGSLNLSDLVSTHLPEFPYQEKITIEQLLHHSSGIPNPLPLRWIHLLEEHKDFDRNAFFERIFREHRRLEFRPGAKFKYSNLGYVILGQLIEKVSSQPFEKYVTENIVKRCGLDPSSLGFAINPSVHAVGYHKWLSFSNAILGLLIDKKKFMGQREGVWQPFHLFHNNGTSYGGMIGSGKALVTYAQALLKNNGLLLDDYHKGLLFTETKINTTPTAMSLSWFVGTLKGNRYLAHAGGGGGYYSELRVYPDLGVGSVIMFNRSGMRDERILNRTDSFFIPEKRN